MRNGLLLFEQLRNVECGTSLISESHEIGRVLARVAAPGPLWAYREHTKQGGLQRAALSARCEQRNQQMHAMVIALPYNPTSL